MRGNSKLKIQNLKLRNGWTYPELIVTAGVLALLVGLTTINLNVSQHQTYTSTSVDTVAADMALQQTRAMSGDVSVGGTRSAYGIYFQTNSYTLFKGNTYSASDPENLVVPLNNTLTFSSIGFPNSQILYASGSGAFANYISGQDTVSMSDTQSNTTKVLHVNSYGVLDSVN